MWYSLVGLQPAQPLHCSLMTALRPFPWPDHSTVHSEASGLGGAKVANKPTPIQNNNTKPYSNEIHIWIPCTHVPLPILGAFSIMAFIAVQYARQLLSWLQSDNTLRMSCGPIQAALCPYPTAIHTEMHDIDY